MPFNLEDITPEGSVVPIYRGELTIEEEDYRDTLRSEFLASESAAETQSELKQSAIQKLAQLGLTIEEAQAIVGL